MIFVREQIAQIYHLLWLLNEAQNGTLFEQVKRSAALFFKKSVKRVT